jgi:peptidoglycan/LPS O-acetylase OafA/YrhL
VQLFFVASALTLCLSAEARRDRRPLLAFYARRLARIAPLFWGGIVFYLWWYGTGRRHFAPTGLSRLDVAATATFTHGWLPTQINAVVPGGWSIAVEMWFYLLFPAVFWIARTPNRAAIIFGLSWAVAAGSAYVHLHESIFPTAPGWLIGHFGEWWLPAQLPVFAAGVLAYHAVSGRGTGVILLCLVAPILLVHTPLGVPQVRWGVAFALLAWGLSLAPIPLLVNAATRHIGRVSFGVYLVHFAAIDIVRAALGVRLSAPGWSGPGQVAGWIPSPLLPLSEYRPAIQFAVLLVPSLALAVAAATLTHFAVERPGVELGRRILRKLGWSSAPANPDNLVADRNGSGPTTAVVAVRIKAPDAAGVQPSTQRPGCHTTGR